MVGIVDPENGAMLRTPGGRSWSAREALNEQKSALAYARETRTAEARGSRLVFDRKAGRGRNRYFASRGGGIFSLTFGNDDTSFWKSSRPRLATSSQKKLPSS